MIRRISIKYLGRVLRRYLYTDYSSRSQRGKPSRTVCVMWVREERKKKGMCGVGEREEKRNEEK
jgi:hypothetical protein